jgi:hypothetical protein
MIRRRAACFNERDRIELGRGAATPTGRLRITMAERATEDLSGPDSTSP